MSVTLLPWTGAGAHIRVEECLEAAQHSRIRSEEILKRVSTPSTFWGSTLRDTPYLLPSAEPPSADGGHLGFFFTLRWPWVLNQQVLSRKNWDIFLKSTCWLKLKSQEAPSWRWRTSSGLSNCLLIVSYPGYRDTSTKILLLIYILLLYVQFNIKHKIYIFFSLFLPKEVWLL